MTVTKTAAMTTEERKSVRAKQVPNSKTKKGPGDSERRPF